MIVIYWKLFSRKRIYYNYGDMTATYGFESGESWSRAKVFRLRDKENKIVLKISPALSGWSTQKLIELQQMLSQQHSQ